MAPQRRRAEIVEAGAAIALTEGLGKLTAKRVATRIGVFPGLVDHYFTADELVAAAFARTVAGERDLLFGVAESLDDPEGQLRCLLTSWLRSERDPVSLLWLDAWQASRYRPALRDEVITQMREDIRRLTQLIQRGIDSGQFRTADPESAAMRILSLIDGLSVQAAVRGVLDYAGIRSLVTKVTEQIFGLVAGSLDAPC
jgi:AcrR family transcriptional regulator